MVKTICIVQARQTSNRLKGKVLLPLGEGGKTIVQHIYERLSKPSLIDKVVFAIPDTSENDELEVYLKKHNLEYYRGDEKNVLQRFIKGIELYHPESVIRATADNPLVDFEKVDDFIKTFEAKNVSYAQYVKTPLGVALEIVKAEALVEAYQCATESFEREHVTPYIYMHPNRFNLYDYEYATEDLSHIRLTVDTPEDYQLMQRVYDDLYHNEPIRISDTLDFLSQHNNLMQINKDIVQKTLKDVE